MSNKIKVRKVHKSWIITVIVAMVILGIVLFVKHFTSNNTTHVLSGTEFVLKGVADNFFQQLSTGKDPKNTMDHTRACRQVTFEMSKGVITCWIQYEINTAPNDNFKETYNSLQSTLKATDGVSNVIASEYREQTDTLHDTNYQIDFTAQNTVECHISGVKGGAGTSSKFSFMCSQTVDDFLPGYTVEE